MASLDTNGPDENTRPDGADDSPATARSARPAAPAPTAAAVERGTPTRTVRSAATRKPAPAPAPAEPSVTVRKTLKNADVDPGITDEPPELPDRQAQRAAKNSEREAATAAARAARETARAERDAEEAATKAELEARAAADKAEREARAAADKAEREARAAAEKAEREARAAAEKAEREAAKDAERAEREAARENERTQKAAAKAAAEAERQAAKESAEAARREAKESAEAARREAKLTAKAEQIAAKEAEQARREAAKDAERAAKAAEKAAVQAEKAAAKEAAKAARAARKPRRDLRPHPFGVITVADWERPAEAATVLFKRAEFTATEMVDWYLRHKRSRKRASRLLRALAILLVATGMLVPLLVPAVALLRPEYGYALFAAAAACVAFDHFFGLSSGWMRDVVTAQAVHARLEALRFDWAGECARSALTTRRTMDEVDRQLTLLRDFSDDIVALTSAETAEWMAEFRLSVTSARQRMGRASQARRAGAHAAERP